MNVLVLMEDEQRGLRLKQFLEREGHLVAFANTPRKAMLLAQKRRPECVVTETPDALTQLDDLRGAISDQAPVLLFEPTDTWRSVMDAISSVDLVSEEAPVEGASSTVEEQSSQKPSVMVVHQDDTERRRIVSALAKQGWAVRETGDIVRASVTMLENKMDCLVVQPLYAGRFKNGLIKSYATVRDAHPNPFCIVAVVDAVDAESLAIAVEEGADDVVAGDSSPERMNWRIKTACERFFLLREVRAQRELVS